MRKMFDDSVKKIDKLNEYVEDGGEYDLKKFREMLKM